MTTYSHHYIKSLSQYKRQVKERKGTMITKEKIKTVLLVILLFAGKSIIIYTELLELMSEFSKINFKDSRLEKTQIHISISVPKCGVVGKN